MLGFRALPIGRKLVVIGLTTVGLALFLNSVSALIATFVIIRQSIVDDVVAQSAIIADNTAAAVAFDDAVAAEETLAPLKDKASVDLACLFDGKNQLFARFENPPPAPTCPHALPADGTVANLQGIQSTAPVSIGNRRVGTLYLHGNYSEVWQQLRAQALGAVVGLVLSVLGAFPLMRRLHRTLVDPLSHLSAVATRVSADHDYGIRATKYTDDEIGSLVDAFNEMLAQVQARDAELSKVNLDLSREIVERMRMENERSVLLLREREANRLKDEFLAALSHELRTPLNAILGWAQLLEQTGIEGGTAAQGLASIQRNARAQARLIDDLLDISRIVSGKFHLKTEVVDVMSVVASAVEVVRASAAAKSIGLHTTVEASSCVVSADPERLQQVLWNLLSNAIKFTPSGGRVDVRIAAVGGECTIEVRDTGAGIAPEFIPYVFDRFRQADGSLTREHRGLGLGLAIVHEIVELHGGTVSASSAGRDRGSSFVVRLPLAQQPASGPVAVAPSPVHELEGARVLVIDDDEDAREIASAALKAAGADVVAVASPDEAIERVFEGPAFSVLICDIGMHGMDGYELLRRIREREAADGRATPAVAMTAHASPEDIARATEAGFGWHVAKPVVVPNLLKAAVSGAAVSKANRGTSRDA